MHSDTYLGARLFADAKSNFDEISAEVALNHHERWDGGGYPGLIDMETGKSLKPNSGKKGEAIPIFGRIVALADVYDALCSRRVYKEPWSEDKVLDTIKEESGKHFDPEIVSAFFDVLDVIKSVSQRYPDQEPAPVSKKK